MRRFTILLSIATSLVLAATATGAGSSNEFAVGSAKTGTDAFTGLEHLSFSAHNVAFPPSPCAASGYAVFDSGDGLMHLQVAVQELVIDIFTGTAYFAGPVTSPSNLADQGDWAQFDVFDREDVTPQQFDEGGFPSSDTFQFDGLYPPSPCRAPTLPSQLITQGDIVIKATGPMLLQ